jgi:hypothetical protein
VEAADRLGPAGQRDVDGLGGCEDSELLLAERFAAFLEGRFEVLLEPVGASSEGGTLSGRLVFDGAKEKRDAAILAPKPFDAPCLDSRFIGRGGETREGLGAQVIDLCHSM